MRVVQVGPYPPPHGGVQANIVAIREVLRSRGIACTVINVTRFRTATDEGVYHPKTALELLGLLIRRRSDIVHVHIGGNVTLRLLGLSAACCLLPKAQGVLTFHSGGYPGSAEGQTARPFTLRGWVFRRFARIIAVNSEIAEMFVRFGVRPGRVRVIPPHSLPALSDGPLPARFEEFAAAHDPLLVTVGLLEPEYDLGLQLVALGRVQQRFPGTGLLIVGAGNLEPQLRAQVAALPFARDVLICGDVPQGQTLQLISRAAVFLRTTRYDGDSVAVREALHVGTPVIATDNGMRPAGVRLMPVGDADALGSLIEDVLSRPDSRPAEPAHKDERNIEAVLEVYRELFRTRGQ